MKKAFSLAEVLITLGIIGIVAALTIPTLISNYQEKQTVTRVKEAYSLLSNAVQMAVAENGPVTTWLNVIQTDDAALNHQIFSPIIFNKIIPYLKTVFICDDIISCRQHSYIIYNLVGITNDDKMLDYTGAKLSNGTFIQISSNGSCDSQYEVEDACATIRVDINGPTLPNQKGKDIFVFQINNNGTLSPYKFGDGTFCNFSNNAFTNGNACTEWVILKGNLNYLKCDGLSINGKDTCD